MSISSTASCAAEGACGDLKAAQHSHRKIVEVMDDTAHEPSHRLLAEKGPVGVSPTPTTLDISWYVACRLGEAEKLMSSEPSRCRGFDKPACDRSTKRATLELVMFQIVTDALTTT